jgi:hypothetical protein
VDVRLYSCVVETSFQLPRFGRLIECRDRHHNFSGMHYCASRDQTSNHC